MLPGACARSKPGMLSAIAASRDRVPESRANGAQDIFLKYPDEFLCPGNTSTAAAHPWLRHRRRRASCKAPRHSKTAEKAAPLVLRKALAAASSRVSEVGNCGSSCCFRDQNGPWYGRLGAGRRRALGFEIKTIFGSHTHTHLTRTRARPARVHSVTTCPQSDRSCRRRHCDHAALALGPRSPACRERSCVYLAKASSEML